MFPLTEHSHVCSPGTSPWMRGSQWRSTACQRCHLAPHLCSSWKIWRILNSLAEPSTWVLSCATWWPTVVAEAQRTQWCQRLTWAALWSCSCWSRGSSEWAAAPGVSPASWSTQQNIRSIWAHRARCFIQISWGQTPDWLEVPLLRWGNPFYSNTPVTHIVIEDGCVTELVFFRVVKLQVVFLHEVLLKQSELLILKT